VYGRSKLAGEHEVGPHATTVRTAWLAGTGGPNLVRTVLGLAADPDRILTFVDDQRGSPTVAEDLAGMLFRLASERRTGLFHVTNQGAATWYELVRHVLAVGGHDPARVRPITTADLRPPRPAPRPVNAVLDNAVLRLVGVPLLSQWQDAVARLVRRLQNDQSN
jgi:dTDP-4-dehydrorhamnose reductase